ncbi:MAG: nucleoside kinase [Eubacteriales bacterium]|nr:nucleoside kinase [Eubacteriales bacterium]
MRVTLETGMSSLLFKEREGITLEEFAEEHALEIPVQPIAARVNNQYQDLLQKIPDNASVRLYGLEYRPAIRVYEDSLSMLFVTALRNVFGAKSVEIQNSLNQGFYAEIPSMIPVPDAALEEIQIEMRTMAEEQVPFERVEVPKAQALKIFEEQGDSAHLIELLQGKEKEKFSLIRIDGQYHFPFGLVVPSAGYLKVFELSPYHKGLLIRYPNCKEPEELPPYHDQPNLYIAFAEQEKWESITGVNFVNELNRKIDSGDARELVLLSEALHEKRLVEISDEIRDSRKRMILVAGPSSSGKTTFARRLAVQLQVNGLHPTYFSTDDYFVNRDEMVPDKNGELNYENLDAVDLDLFKRNMNQLLAGEKTDLPVFNFMTGKKEFGKRIVQTKDDDPIVIEGIHALNRKLSEGIPEDEIFRIYISPLTQINLDEHNRVPTTDERMLRRLVRDYRFRGHSASMTLDLWPNVRNGEDTNIFPYSGEADATYNSYHIYEIALLKKYAEPILRQVRKDDPNYPEAERILRLLRWFRTIDDDSIVPNNSIIREFIGGSIFVE